MCWETMSVKVGFFQKLHLVSPPAFSVDRITSSACGSRLCLWGSRGVMVLELPSRWSRGGLFDSGKKTILCNGLIPNESPAKRKTGALQPKGNAMKKARCPHTLEEQQ
ncbi:unnamed protein product [Danaus chrysippus]|uniref:(African queen) hypothetical protein n=1 Tax=Danaus chrysippus TaxID=151541 RepID=A0A8J2QBZ3_9NEOP|nr:unnamed protein product [Danaus chrysippus]